MRAAGWIFIICCLMGAGGLFMPSVGVEDAGFLAKKTSMSLYTMSTKRALTSNVIAMYHRFPGKGIGHAVAKALIPRTGRVGSLIDDLDSAASTLDDVSDADVGLAGKALVAIIWILLVLDVIAAGLMFKIVMAEAPPRPKRIALPLGISILTLLLTIAVVLVLREAVWQANDEIGKSILTVRGGAYLMLVAAIGAAGSAIAFVVLAKRAKS